MKKLLVLLSILGGMFANGITLAAEPTRIKVGILLPLTGTFAAVAETQRDGALLAIDVVNKRGGLNMPWGKVTVEGVVADDEAKQDVGRPALPLHGFRRCQGRGRPDLGAARVRHQCHRSQGADALFPRLRHGQGGVPEGQAVADSTFATAYSPWTVGYMAGQAAIKTLGKKRIFFLARADSWGWDMRDGVTAAAKELGAEIVGYDEVSLGTSDYTTILQKVRAAKPDVFISAQFAADAVALLKQVHQMGLSKEMTIFNAFITNVVAKGLPPEALEGVYSMHYFYYDLSRLPGQGSGKKRQGVHAICTRRSTSGRPTPMQRSPTSPTWRCSGASRPPNPSIRKRCPRP